MKKIISKVHLILGLASGLVVFIIAVTGCIYTFQAELQEMTQPYRHVEPQELPMLPPSSLRKIADQQLPGKSAHSVLYGGKTDAAKVVYYSRNPRYYDFVYLNPYTGQVLKVKNELKDFFRIVLDGHFYLWLPPKYGQPLVASATLIFVVLLLSGLFLWWPRNKNGRRQRFTIKWDARWRRKNYDLHNVLGFYVLILAMILALTGLIWGFQWFRNSVYFVASGGNVFQNYSEPQSDTTTLQKDNVLISSEDRIWLKMQAEYPDAATIDVHFADEKSASVEVTINPEKDTYYQMEFRFFDRYSLKELSVNHMWGRQKDLSGADKLMRMNYDIHVGAIGGLAGKFLAFFASLLIATLPVTGTLIWWGRRRKSKHKPYQATQDINKLSHKVEEVIV